jgi:hypothetical protein
MKIRIFITAIFFLLYSSALFAEPFADKINALKYAARGPLKAMAEGFAPVMGFYTGSANMLGVNIASFPSLKIGLGAGGAVNTALFNNYSIFESMNGLSFSDSKSISNSSNKLKDILKYMPMPYYTVYGKVGIPVLPADAGIRLSIIPTMNFSRGDSSLGIGAFHLGGEFRYSLLQTPDGGFRVDSRASLDYDSGFVDVKSDVNQDLIIGGTNVGNQNIKMNMKYGWSGVSIGGKLQAGMYNKSVGGLYAGAGINLNLGGTKASMDSDVIATPNVIGIVAQHANITGEFTQGYDPFELRVYAGGQLFFMQLAVEYGILSGFMAATFYPVALEF